MNSENFKIDDYKKLLADLQKLADDCKGYSQHWAYQNLLDQIKNLKEQIDLYEAFVKA